MYNYQNEKPKLFTDEGQRNIIAVRDHVLAIIAGAGAITMDKAMSGLSGDSWTMMAYVDRLVELGDIKEVAQPDGTPGQYRIFVSGRNR